MKTVKVMEEEWDYLIVLDACRYDCFSKLYNKFLEGTLERRLSLGSCTSEWCKRNFTEYYPDVIYISANPHINSKAKIFGFQAKRHFYKIIDVWNNGWDDKLGTVPPERVNEATLRAIKSYPKKRFIIHYLQPHAPYISPKFQSLGFSKPHPHAGIILQSPTREATEFLGKIANYVESISKKLRLGNGIAWKLREVLRLPPATPMDAARRKLGVNGLKRAYLENLRIVLENIAILIKHLSGNIVITSDHGELLGEKWKYSHPCGYKTRILREVPWFRVTKVKDSAILRSVRLRLKWRIKLLKIAKNADFERSPLSLS